ncbi:uncharacterized protein LOC122665686 [Telopea speciosissima]|uniref:uncharacterized protein LOC122665686 n=1 Tax=Telopea speciosissima TaxID=54955 RepID=UPI001CC5ED93|nr:uncharacterized protein LOC122665686 [Telopea speciosissima]
MTEALIAAWNTTSPVIVSNLLQDTYLFKFEHQLDVYNVLQEAPWSVAGNLIVLERWRATMDWTFSSTEMWLQLHDIPEELHDPDLITRLAHKLGEVSRVQYINGVRGGQRLKFYRVHTRVDVTKPLRRSLKIKRRSGVDQAAEIKYERLPLFCYYCGYLGHDEQRCRVLFEDETSHRASHHCDPVVPCSEFLRRRFMPYLRCPAPGARLVEHAMTIFPKASPPQTTPRQS